jgi:hypothetical protein
MKDSKADPFAALWPKLDELERVVRASVRGNEWERPAFRTGTQATRVPTTAPDATDSFMASLLSRLFGGRR